MGQPHRAIFQAAPWPPAAAGPSPPPHEPLPDPAWEAHARLEAARGVWGALLGLPAWCMARRARAVAAGRAGWAPTLRALSLLDDMLHYEVSRSAAPTGHPRAAASAQLGSLWGTGSLSLRAVGAVCAERRPLAWGGWIDTAVAVVLVGPRAQDSHPRPAYCAAADRIKLALLRDVPGAVPGAVKADVAARQIIATLHMVRRTAPSPLPSTPGQGPLARTTTPVPSAARRWLAEVVVPVRS